MTITTDLLTGIAGMLQTAGIGVTASGTPFAPTDTAITYLDQPADPDHAITLTDYPVSDDARLPLTEVGVQIRMRGAPSDWQGVLAIRDAVYTLLQSATNLPFGSITVIQLLRHSSLPDGQDDLMRYEYVDNYYADIDLPATVNRPG